MDMLAGLSKTGILGTPPGFCATAGALAANPTNGEPTATSTRNFRFMSASFCSAGRLDEPVVASDRPFLGLFRENAATGG
jgi:hypothetical protein